MSERRVRRDDDGKYRWIYEMSLFRNPTIFILVWKIIFFLMLGITLIMILAAIRWGWERILGDLKVMGIVLLGMTALTALGYLLYAAVMGGKYVVEFEMDERGVNHRQVAWQAARARKIGRAAMMAGASSGRMSTSGAGWAAQRTEMYSEFEKVKKVRFYPRRHLIKITAGIEHNQVYAEKEDFDLVKDFIITHCPNLK